MVADIPVEIVRKPIKHLHLGVYPPHGHVRVSVPLRVDDDAIRLAVITRLRWIRQQQAQFAQQARQDQRAMVSGESHYVEGQRYRLNVVEQHGPPHVRRLNNQYLELQVRPGHTRIQREAVLHQWYRQQLRSQIPALIAKWEPLIGVAVAAWGIKRMKTRWGTCNTAARRIWLNLELAKKPLPCLEYVVVHEMVHLLERHHNTRFQAHLDRLLPHWRFYRAILNQEPLANEQWAVS